jgi:hypothetical protein
MTESEKLVLLRDKLVRRRRAVVGSYQEDFADRSVGDDIARIQGEIEALDRAIIEEKRAEFRP